eukprot:7383479-Prymnesium_polylepis.2
MDFMIQSDVFSAFRSETTRRHPVFPPGLRLPTDTQVYSTLALLPPPLQPPPPPPVLRPPQLAQCAVCSVHFPATVTPLCGQCHSLVEFPPLQLGLSKDAGQRAVKLKQLHEEEASRLANSRRAAPM